MKIVRPSTGKVLNGDGGAATGYGRRPVAYLPEEALVDSRRMGKIIPGGIKKG